MRREQAEIKPVEDLDGANAAGDGEDALDRGVGEGVPQIFQPRFDGNGEVRVGFQDMPAKRHAQTERFNPFAREFDVRIRDARIHLQTADGARQGKDADFIARAQLVRNDTDRGHWRFERRG